MVIFYSCLYVYQRVSSIIAQFLIRVLTSFETLSGACGVSYQGALYHWSLEDILGDLFPDPLFCENHKKWPNTYNMNIIYTDYFGCFLTFCPHLLGQKPWPIFSFHLGDEEPLPCVGWGGSRYGNRRQQGARGWDASRPEPGRTKQLASPIYKGLYTGWWFGTWIYLSIYWEFHHPNWRTHIFQRGRYTTNQYMNLWYIDLVNGGYEPSYDDYYVELEDHSR